MLKRLSTQWHRNKGSSSGKLKKNGIHAGTTTNEPVKMKFKRKGFCSGLSENPRKRKLKRREIKEKNDPVDLISCLPEHIIHHILSLLRSPKDAARIVILSKKWKSIWDSFATFDFEQRCFDTVKVPEGLSSSQGLELRRGNFKKFVDQSLLTRILPMFCIQKYKLRVTSSEWFGKHCLDGWICAASDKQARELEIDLDGMLGYFIPKIVLAAKSITSLKFSGCHFGSSAVKLELHNLKILSIKRASVDETMIRNFVCSCPLLEDFRLVRCLGFSSLHVSALLKLKRVEIHECKGVELVEIESPKLEIFWFHEHKYSQCKINLLGCENLKKLTLKDGTMVSEMFQTEILKFPVLENLVLMGCDALERITIISDSLKGLALVRCKRLLEVNVDAPNLFSFEYTGNKMPVSSINSPGMRDVKLHLESYRSLTNRVQKFIKCFDQFDSFMVVLYDKQNMLVYDDLREVMIPLRNKLKLELTKSSEVLRNLVDSQLHVCQPGNLTVVASSNVELLKSIQDMILHGVKNPSCCTYCTRKCWRHYLDDVEICEVLYSPLVERRTEHGTTFRLKWRSVPTLSAD